MSRAVRWALGILTASLVIVMIALVVSGIRNEANRRASRQKLKQIGIALHAYHDKYECFPPAYVRGPDGKPWHSWRVLLLPFLDQQKLYDRYRFDEPWNGPNNKQLQSLRPDAFASPLQQSRGRGITTYLGVVSRRTMWPAHFSISLSDVTDGPSNTIMLIENGRSDVIWSEPREMREADAIALLRPMPAPDAATGAATPPQTSDLILLLFGDGSLRAIAPYLNRDLFVSMLTPKYGAVMVDEGWPVDEAAPSRIPTVVDISKYPGTVVLTTADAAFDPNKSSVYCATTQLAWDYLRPTNGLPVAVGVVSPTADSLNAHPFPKDALDEKSYYVGSGRLDKDSSAAMFNDFRARFPNAPVEALENSNDLEGTRILAYLEKSLPFPDVMTRFELPLTFETKAIESFGWPANKNSQSESQVLISTVEVRDYTSEKDFIVLLKTNSPKRDEIILARVAPEASLEATWLAVADRIKSPKVSNVVRELREIDELQIPILSFGVVATLKDLIGLPISTAQIPGRHIADARQTIRFRLDEYGAELIADTQMIIGDFGDDPPVNPRAPRRLIFDGPFLIAMKQKSAEVPYFLAWIGNADLMEMTKATDSR